MLYIDNTNNYIYLTKGDSATITIALGGTYTPEVGDEIEFYVRNSRNLDTIYINLTQSSGTDTSSEAGYITQSIENSNEWSIFLKPAATENLKRTKYVYDIKLKRANGEIITFVGGEKSKLEFWVT